MSRLTSLMLIALFALLALSPATPVAALREPAAGAVAKPADFVIVPPWAQGVERAIFQGYGDISTHQHTDRAGGPNDYHALDFDFALDEPVLPIAPGRVIYAGPATDGWARYGNVVFIDHENGYQSFYAHLNTIDPAVLKGAGDTREVRVTTATRLGGAGRTGGWAQVHLHLALYKGASFNLSNERYGPFGGQSVVPEPFAACVKDGERPCEDLLKGAKLRRTAAAGEAPAPLRIAVVRPTAAQPAPAGAPGRPGKLIVELDLSAGDLAPSELSVRVGQAQADLVLLAGGHRARAEVVAPAQAAPGLYDLTVSARGVSAVAPQAVRYAEAGGAAVALVIDRSGSMSGPKLAAAVESAKQFVDLMRPGDKLAGVRLGSSPRVASPLQTPGGRGDPTGAAARLAIESLYAAGSTAIGAGLGRGQDELDARALPNLARAAVLLSDGQENVSPSAAAVLPRLVGGGTALHTIGYGADANQADLLRWAAETGGTFNFAPAPDQLSGVYSSIAGAVGNRQTLRAVSGSLAAGATHSELVAVDGSVRDATFAASWSRPTARIAVSLETPRGAVISPATAAATPGVTYVSGGTYAYFRVTAPALVAGAWKLRLAHGPAPADLAEAPATELAPDPEALLSDRAEDGWSADVARPDAQAAGEAAAAPAGLDADAAPAQAAGEPFSLRVLAESDLTLRLYLTRDTYRAREGVRLLATLADRRPVTGAAISVTVRDGAGRVVGLLALRDSGMSNDGAAGDGVYGGAWLSRRDGVHTFVATAVGAQGALMRQAEVSTFIAPNPTAPPLRQVFLPFATR